MDYPALFDCVWLASDNFGRLAAMITAGEGPIPATALATGTDITETEERLLELPAIGRAHLNTEVPNPASFLELSERGFFVYDWTDVYGSQRRAYELVCSPSRHLERSALPDRLLGLDFKIDTRFGVPFVNVR